MAHIAIDIAPVAPILPLGVAAMIQNPALVNLIGVAAEQAAQGIGQEVVLRLRNLVDNWSSYDQIESIIPHNDDHRIIIREDHDEMRIQTRKRRHPDDEKRVRDKRPKFEPSIEEYSNLFSPLMGKSTLSVGGRVHMGTKEVVPAMKYETCTASFNKFPCGTYFDGVDDYCLIGVFNPVEIMNAQYTLHAGGYLEECSSFFCNQDTTPAAVPAQLRQWDTPSPLNELSTLYDAYNCEFVKCSLKFTNNGTQQNSMRIFWKIMYPGDRNGGSTATDDYSHAVPEAPRSYVVDNNHVYTGDSRKTLKSLRSIRGMRELELGPDTANGAPNEGIVYFEINVKDILNSYDGHGHNNIQTFTEDEIAIDMINHIEKTDAAINGYFVPKVMFWAVQLEDNSQTILPGGVAAVSADLDSSNTHPLWVQGHAEYTCRVFQRKPGSISALHADTT